MKFFLDTANIEEIRDAASTGVLDGITTNPTLISKEGNTFEDQLLKICSLVNGPVSAETVSRDAAGMVPLESMFIETDSPYLAPVPHRGKRNEPAHVVEVARQPLLYSAETGGVIIEDIPPEQLESMKRMLLAMDPPRHGQFRRPVAPREQKRPGASWSRSGEARTRRSLSRSCGRPDSNRRCSRSETRVRSGVRSRLQAYRGSSRLDRSTHG